RYTKFYGTSERAAKDLAHDALTQYKRWEEDIEKWQNPILQDESLPEWCKFTLFNELYFLVAGGTIWIDSPLPSSNMRNKSQDQVKELENTEVKVTEAKVSRRQGADAGRTTDSTYDVETCMQSREIWTGVTYGVASMMILAGMEEEAFATADGIFQAGLVRRWIR
ncbi:hypothetical protein S245_056150, partial [Arachis hypogaea]